MWARCTGLALFRDFFFLHVCLLTDRAELGSSDKKLLCGVVGFLFVCGLVCL